MRNLYLLIQFIGIILFFFFSPYGFIAGIILIVWAEIRYRKETKKLRGDSQRNKISIKVIIKKALIVIGVFCLCAFLFMAFFMNSTKLNAKEIFKQFIMEPIPANVKIIHGGGNWWQGYSAALVFETDKGTFQDISKGYQVLPNCIDNRYGCSAIVSMKKFFKEDLLSMPNLCCYYKRIDIRHGGDAYLFYDKDNNKVFFCASGG